MLSLVIPTLNEAPNLRPLLRAVSTALYGVEHEILIVDDASTDGTPELAESLRSKYPALRVLRRTQDFGLSAAILEGFRAAKGDVLGVMDADLQHDPRVLPDLLRSASTADIAIGSRYAFQGKTCGWSVLRELQSRLAARLTRFVLGLAPLDPLSGFFMLRRSVFEGAAPHLQARGWKLLLEILVLAERVKVSEVPFTFKARLRGETKMNFSVIRTWISELFRLRRRHAMGTSSVRPASFL